MLFTSLEFLCAFLPLVLLVNFLLPKVLRNYWLLLASLFFYAWGEPSFVIFMLISIVFNYAMALGVAHCPSEGKHIGRKCLMAVTVAGNLGLLFVYKYLNFFTSILRSAFPQLQSTIPQTEFLLPIGISFFTFQAMSYVIDVYRGTRVQKNPASLGMYISFFPQLIAGPIVRYTTVEEQIRHRVITVDSFCEGVRRFIIGFNKKMLLANVLGEAADAIFAMSGMSTLTAWVGIACYTLQIFYDFAGYSDMAIGLGKMFGFNFLENFDYPYCSGSITEFWRRWHISLGSWFRDYVYFPLGGSRVKSKLRLVFNLAAVWLLTGVWHGANWTFILWGVLYGVLIIFEKLLGIPAKAKDNRGFGFLWRILTLLAVMLGWVLFRADDLGQAGAYIAAMFMGNATQLWDATGLYYLREYLVVLLVGIVCATPIFRTLREKLIPMPKAGTALLLAGYLGQILLFLCSIAALVMNAHNPFIYFNF
ncbi:MAG: MBOAT family protein [Clostridia bacterium]|nr:MBOAT family protein [Clostridia bacterium]